MLRLGPLADKHDLPHLIMQNTIGIGLLDVNVREDMNLQ